MARSPECTEQYPQKVRDTADICQRDVQPHHLTLLFLPTILYRLAEASNPLVCSIIPLLQFRCGGRDSPQHKTPRSPMSHLRLHTIFATLVLFPATLSYSQQYTQASCTFNLFQAPGLVGGVNDFRTTVGQSSSNAALGFVRYSGGNVSYFSPPNAASTNPSGRNDGGASVGFYTTQGSSIRKGFILQGSTFTSFTHPKAVHGTVLTANNKYNSTVGYFFDSANITHGFKRYSNGGLVSLNYPGASGGTQALGINDYGTVVGSFVSISGGNAFEHGFLYHGGTWAQVDYSTNPGTSLDAISNTNVVVGHFQWLSTYISFLYANGVFKNIFVPNADSTQVTDISAKGVISGNAAYSDGSVKEFTATCK